MLPLPPSCCLQDISLNIGGATTIFGALREFTKTDYLQGADGRYTPRTTTNASTCYSHTCTASCSIQVRQVQRAWASDKAPGAARSARHIGAALEALLLPWLWSEAGQDRELWLQTRCAQVPHQPRGASRHAPRHAYPIHCAYPCLVEAFVVQGTHEDESKYTLAGVVVHHGMSLSSGHYIAYVRGRKKGADPTRRWFKMNDSHVSTPHTHIHTCALWKRCAHGIAPALDSPQVSRVDIREVLSCKAYLVRSLPSVACQPLLCANAGSPPPHTHTVIL